MKKKVYLGTNTKMYKGIADTVAYLEELCRLTADISREALELFVIPSFTALESARRCAPEALVRLGAGRSRDLIPAKFHPECSGRWASLLLSWDTPKDGMC